MSFQIGSDFRGLNRPQSPSLTDWLCIVSLHAASLTGADWRVLPDQNRTSDACCSSTYILSKNMHIQRCAFSAWSAHTNTVYSFFVLSHSLRFLDVFHPVSSLQEAACSGTQDVIKRLTILNTPIAVKVYKIRPMHVNFRFN